MRKVISFLVILSTCFVLNSARTFALGDHYTVEQVIDLYSKDKNIVLAFFNGVDTAINWANSALEAQGRTRLYCPPCWDLGQEMVKNLIGEVRGVQTVENVFFQNKNSVSSGYSQYLYPFDIATRNDVIYPSLDPSIFELKYPTKDIKGRVTTY